MAQRRPRKGTGTALEGKAVWPRVRCVVPLAYAARVSRDRRWLPLRKTRERVR